MASIEGLISDLGTESFRAGLYGYLEHLAGADHVSLLRFDADGRARLVCAASRPRWRFPQDAQRAYLEQFHAQDPNRGVFAARPQPGAQVRRLRREQVPGADYRHYCYDAARLVDRLSVLCGDGGGGYALNLYRGRERGAFAEGEAARLHGQASLLAALCVKHDRLCLERGDDAAAQGIDGHAARLAHLQRGLSRRELAVAARVLAGMTSEGIALDLGIGLQSVLTYRKRAYAKLGVSGQRQLFALALRPYRG
ncbi:MAG: helix-turn-helix transcriptional regulator [Rhodocyclaceae bacterium]|jgi:DNA-binding CsgD family transcriptional regulator|nr:helix-turn-helix transcriptional regulator [Rhodocyclaceae bacterium]